MMIESALPSTSTSLAPNALAVCSGTSGIIGHMKKNCWAKGGGSKGKGPRWYNVPKGMDPLPKPVIAASIKEEEDHFAAAANIYEFSDYDFRDSPPGSNAPVPMFIDSGASHCGGVFWIVPDRGTWDS
ncbi:hypothetical protein F5050DRAFT_1709120 [Lentinula boryana]|uniref:Uncharacterized protein n=1 Tax=Lentinula boryana TaxID=40481 RepID=A0ABQ8QPM0_9AGAR|nr:hypothetical protein F5050DRAFT_1709120 [Lentinula boryana]